MTSRTIEQQITDCRDAIRALELKPFGQAIARETADLRYRISQLELERDKP